MKLFRLMIATLLLLSGAARADHHSEPQTIRVGIFQLEPLNFFDEDGTAQGLNSDLLREIVSDQDEWELEFVPVQWAEGLEKLQTEEIDLMVSVAYTPQRAQTMDYNGSPVLEVWGQAFVNSDTSIEDISDLTGENVGIMRGDLSGDNFIKLTENFEVSCEVAQYATHEDVFNAVQAGEVYAGIAPHHFGLRHASLHDLKGSPIQFSPFSVFFAAKKGVQQEFLAEIDFHLGRWKQDRESYYYERIEYWLNKTHATHRPIPRWFWMLAAGIGSLAGLLFGANRLLQRQVQKRTAELHASEERFEIATEAGGIGVWDRDIINDRLIWDDRMYELYGVRKEHFGGAYEAWKQCIHPDDLERAEAEVNAAEQGEKPFNTEFRIIRADTGETRHIRAFGKIIRDTKGNAVRMIGTNQDITEQKQAEAARVESDRKMRISLENSPVCTKFLDLDFNLQYMSSAGVKALGVDDVTQLYGKPYPFSFYPDSFNKPMIRNLEKAKATGETISQEAAVVDLEGNELWFLSTIVPVKNEKDQLDYLMVISMETTERKKAEMALKARNNELERFNKAAVGRELRMIELKEEISSLSRELGKEPPYSSNS